MNISPVRNIGLNSCLNFKNANNLKTLKTKEYEQKMNENIYSGLLASYPAPYLSNTGLNISFGINIKPFYAIDRNGNCIRFENRREATQKLGMAQSSINSVIAGQLKAIHGYTFAYAGDIEKKDENGNSIVDNDKVQEVLKNLKKAKRTRFML